MAGVTIENVEKSFSSGKVIRNLDIEARDGEFVVLVGRRSFRLSCRGSRHPHDIVILRIRS